MNIIPFHPRNQRGYALMMVLVMTGISLLILGSALTWSSNNAVHTQRYIQYYNTLGAAEAATEKVLADIIPIYQKEGEAAVYGKLSTYASWVPTTAESSLWSDYAFNDGAHNAASIDAMMRAIGGSSKAPGTRTTSMSAAATPLRVKASMAPSSSLSVMKALKRATTMLMRIPVPWSPPL